MRILTTALAVGLAACTPTPAAIGSPSASLASATAPTPAPAATVARTAQSTGLVPTLEPDPAFAGLQIRATAEASVGTPGEGAILEVTRPVVDAAYISRVASALGISGPGTLEASPDGTAPWRLWLGTRILAINERTGDVLFFDPRAGDAGATGAARGPFDVLGALGGDADYGGPLRSFSGSEWLAGIDRVVDGSWLQDDSRDAFALFPRYHNASGSTGTTVFGTDEFALLTPMGRPVEIIHRPLVRVDDGPVYPITLFGYAVGELLASPARYLHFLSVRPTGSLTLTIDTGHVVEGHAWAGGSGGITHLGAQLVPVWVFPATGTTDSGASVQAIFLVDAVAPQFRAPVTSSALAITADALLRTQLGVSVGGHRIGLLSAEGALQDQLNGICPGGTYSISNTDPDTATASVSCPNGAHATVSLRRAFPGLVGSIWYVSALAK